MKFPHVWKVNEHYKRSQSAANDESLASTSWLRFIELSFKNEVTSDRTCMHVQRVIVLFAFSLKVYTRLRIQRSKKTLPISAATGLRFLDIQVQKSNFTPKIRSEKTFQGRFFFRAHIFLTSEICFSKMHISLHSNKPFVEKRPFFLDSLLHPLP